VQYHLSRSFNLGAGAMVAAVNHDIGGTTYATQLTIVQASYAWQSFTTGGSAVLTDEKASPSMPQKPALLLNAAYKFE
jgi:hypothetical protein